MAKEEEAREKGEGKWRERGGNVTDFAQ